MKEQLQNHKRKGSSLMFVIIAVAFVGILSTIILKVTMINIETKSTDRGVKKDFYSAEAVMDKLNIAMEDICKDAMKEAYVDLLQNYSSDGLMTTDQNTVQNKFAKNYLTNLITKLAPGKAMYEDANNAGNYVLAADVTYDPDVIEKAMNDAFRVDDKMDVGSRYLDIKDSEAKLELKYNSTKYNEDYYLTLKNVKVNYKETVNGEDMATWITTDIKLVVPKLSFEGANIYPDFTKYAIIGDDKVDAKGGTQASVTGNVYAGNNGLNVSGGNNNSLTIDGSSSRLVTRGDVNVQQTGGLTLGSAGNPIEVWAENYRTSILDKDSEAEASLTVYGDSYIHDDLSLDGPYSNVNFKEGKYYGYSFNMDNTMDNITTVDSEYSSAIVINGRHSKLNMDTGMTEILLGGRAFISRNKDVRRTEADFQKRTDIPIGESISVKCNEKFYLVSMDDLADGFTNPMSVSKYNDMMDAGKEPLSDQAKKTLRTYLDAGTPVTNYVYDLSGTSTDAAMVYFYYNFKSQSAADRYFRDYCDKNEMSKKIVSSEYLKFGGDGKGGIDINISQNLSLLTAGNALWFNDKNGGLKSQQQTITEDNEDFYKKESITKAAKYKSYQLTLTEGEWSNYIQSGVSGHGNPDDEDDSGFDLVHKDKNRVYDTLMLRNTAETQYVFVEEAKQSGDTYGFKVLNGSIKYKAVPVDIGGGKTAWAVFVAETSDSVITGEEPAVSASSVLNTAGITDTANTPVILVSNCNIKVNCNMRGLVISRNTVSFEGTPVKITADSAALQDMFSAQKSKEGSLNADKRFLRYFKCFEKMSFGDDVNNAQDSVDFSSCVKYANWKKNNE